MLAGIFLFLSLLTSLFQELVVTNYLPFAGIFAWLSALFLIAKLPVSQKKVVSIIALTGLLGCAIGWSSGIEIDGMMLLSKNQSLITLLIGVTFLRLVAFPVSGAGDILPKGESSFVRTFWGIHLFGAVINLSAVLLAGDRFFKEKPLSVSQTIVLTRAFSACANWSPFFAAFAVALLYAPDASFPVVWAVGSVSVLTGFAVTWWQMKQQGMVDSFIGFPIHFEALWLPVVLAIAVILGHQFYPAIKIIIMIAGCAVVITFFVLLSRYGGRSTVVKMGEHITQQLPKMQGELLLFLAAGVMSVGLASFIESQAIEFPVTQFNGVVAAITLILMVLVAIIGVHPIISIAVVGESVSYLAADQTLLAVLFLMAWAIGINVSPFSGLNMALHGRYGLSGKSIFNWNKYYALFMTITGSILLLLLDLFLSSNGGS